jgi:two-component system CitB family sensor kinase
VIKLRDWTELYEALRELDGQRTLTETLRAQAH